MFDSCRVCDLVFSSMADLLLNEDAFSNEKSQELFEVIDKLHSCGAKAYIDIPEVVLLLWVIAVYPLTRSRSSLLATNPQANRHCYKA